VGPDGAVWVLDWYNFIVQHNPTPNKDRGGYDAINGKGNAYVNPLRDKSRGRIWRIIPKNIDKEGKMILDKEDPDALIKALSNDNMFWRLTAQRLLVNRQNPDVLPKLYKLANSSQLDALGMAPGALHALWTIDGLADLNTETEAYDVVKGGVFHPAGAVRKAAIQILPRNTNTDEALLEAKSLFDKDPKVQMAALLYFSERNASEKIGNILYELSKKAYIAEDYWLSKSLYTAASKHVSGFIQGFIADNPGYDLESGIRYKREDFDYDDSNWETMELPQYIEAAGLDIDGIIWFRKNILLNANPTAKTGNISLGPINDSDMVYINGKLVGATEQQHQKNRNYVIPSGILKQGMNVIAVRVEDIGNNGGIYGKKQQLSLKVGSKALPLYGNWKYEVEKDFSKRHNNVFANSSIAKVFVDSNKDKTLVSRAETSDDGEITAVIRIKTIPNEMKYDLTEFDVKPGQQVELILENVDFMQHNLVIVKPGQKEKVGAAADKLAADPKGSELQYVPQMGEVLFATALVDPEQKVTLRFTAPTKAGEYPFICTFPGHWRLMQGVMRVKAN
ncbi:MAG: beta galactosidase jelly roll domain-containing protein, partial [Eudoraea sp.]|nr:beta galactosidase jelly roll domain-containing protein [Eudoraea sp.]